MKFKSTSNINCTSIFLILVTLCVFCIDWTYSSIAISPIIDNNENKDINGISQFGVDGTSVNFKVLADPDLNQMNFIINRLEINGNRKLNLVSTQFAWPGNSDTFHIAIVETDYQHSLVPKIVLRPEYSIITLDSSDIMCMNIPFNINTLKGSMKKLHCYKLVRRPDIATNVEIQLAFEIQKKLSFTDSETFEDKMYQFALTISPPGMTAVGKTYDFSLIDFLSTSLIITNKLESIIPVLDQYNKVDFKIAFEQTELFEDILSNYYNLHIILESSYTGKNPGWQFNSYEHEVRLNDADSTSIKSEVTIDNLYVFFDSFLKDRVMSNSMLVAIARIHLKKINVDNPERYPIITISPIRVVDKNVIPSWNDPIATVSLNNKKESNPTSTEIKVEYDFIFTGSVGNYLLQFYLQNTLVPPSQNTRVNIELTPDHQYCSLKITQDFTLIVDQVEVTHNPGRRCNMKLWFITDIVNTSSDNYDPTHYTLNVIYSDPYEVLPSKPLNHYQLLPKTDNTVMKITAVYAPTAEDVIIQTRFGIALTSSNLSEHLVLRIDKLSKENNGIVKVVDKDWEKSVYFMCSQAETETTYFNVNVEDNLNTYVFNLPYNVWKDIPNPSSQLIYCELVVGWLLIDDIELNYSFTYQSTGNIVSKGLIHLDDRSRGLLKIDYSGSTNYTDPERYLSSFTLLLHLTPITVDKDIKVEKYHDISFILENNFLAKNTMCTVNEEKAVVSKLGKSHFIIPIPVTFNITQDPEKVLLDCIFQISPKYITPVQSAFTFVFSDNLHLLENIAFKTKISQKDLWSHSLDNFYNPNITISSNNNTRSVPITTVTWRDIENILARRLKDIKDLYYKAGGTQLKKDLIHLVDLTANGSHTIVDVDVDVDIIYTASIGYEGDFPFNLEDFHTSFNNEINQSPDLHDMSVEVKLEQVPSKCLSAASTCGEECAPCLGTEICKTHDDCFSGLCQEGKCKEYSTLTSPEDNHSHIHQVSGVLILILSFIGFYLA